MKRKALLVLLLSASQLLLFAQSPREIDNLFHFSKVWGFLKYHHSNVAQGKLNWDSVFVTNVDKVKAADKKEFYAVLQQILSAIGPHSAKGANIPDDLFTENKVDDLGWIKGSTLLDPVVKGELISICGSPYQGENKYVKKYYETSDYSGEAVYKDMILPDVRYRLLFLSRFWNVINYFAPYKYLIGDNWNNSLKKFIPMMVQANDTTSYYKNLSLLAASLNDGHAQVTRDFQMSPITDRVFGKYTVPFNCQIISDTVIVRHVMHLAPDGLDIKVGDKIMEVNGTPISILIKERMPYLSASNPLNKKFNLSWYILNGHKLNTRLIVERGNKIFPVDIARIDFAATFEKDWRSFVNHSSSDTVCKWIEDSVLLVYAAQISAVNVKAVKEKIWQSRAVVFDVRNYPNNDAFYAMFDIMLPKPSVLNYSTLPVHAFPGYFRWEASPKLGNNTPNYYKGQVVILVDERTQSQGEYSSMVLQLIPGSITIGRQTAGADGVVTYIPVGGNHNISYSGYGIYYPDKKPTQRVGVHVDITVPQTTGAIREGRDEVLEKALSYLRKL
jgi:carboxyl-terminal processing protease